ncbi:Piwi-domain-containing protein [Mollisia scopiformis]|uniref:Piwi-domain-containing protein n=1 Tax=Mollisia scopiformis TaxID=149040 RepID=A0A194XME8_MOLSC|nr:Piwi-domain-containing protein [Mollisia scopiformis]KUJ21353.1 Piwi-domain-containing protein [Mollisia scopiformis]
MRFRNPSSSWLRSHSVRPVKIQEQVHFPTSQVPSMTERRGRGGDTSGNVNQDPAAAITNALQTFRVAPGSVARGEAARKQEQAQRKEARAVQKSQADSKRAVRTSNYEKWDKASLSLPSYITTGIVASQGERRGEISANYFELSFEPNKKYRRYRIDLGLIDGEEITNNEFKRKLIGFLLTKFPPNSSTKWASDYRSTIISVGKLYGTWSETRPLPRPHPTVERPGVNDLDIPSSIVAEGEFDLANLNQLISKHERPTPYHPDQDINALNILTWRRINDPSWNGIRVKNKFFPKDAKKWRLTRDIETYVDVRGRMQLQQDVPTTVYEARTGFFTSIRPGESKLLLNISTISGAFYAVGVNLQEWMRARYDLAIGATPRAGACKDMRGLKVTFDLRNPTKQWSVYAVSDRSVSQEGFEPNGGGAATSVFDYMTQRYINATFDPNAFCVNLGASGRDVWHPADKLRIVPNQYIVKTLDSFFAGQMIKCTERKPITNQNAITSHALQPLGIAPTQPFWNDFGLRVTGGLIEMPSRYLKQPTIRFSGDATIALAEVDPDASEYRQLATWDLKHMKFYKTSSNLLQLKIIRIEQPARLHGPSMNDVKIFGAQLLDKLPKYNVNFNGSVAVVNVTAVRDGSAAERRTAWAQSLEQAWIELKKPGFLLIALATENATIFSDIKFWCDCVKGVPSMCVKPKCIAKNKEKSRPDARSGDGRLLGNVCMKINFKLGGVNQVVLSDSNTWMAGVKRGTMIVGADVTHSGKGLDSTIPSLAAVVATCCPDAGVYLGSARLQTHNTEFIENLASMIEERVLRFVEAWGKGPDHILFYRDGVSESQYGMVYEEELPQIRQGAKAAGQKKCLQINPAITLLVVGKRHHTRFFPKWLEGQKPAPKAGDRSTDRNTVAGLIIDHTVVTPHHFSFYLQSHDSPIGTARTGHYVVISNGSNYSPDELQQITHKLCFTGSRATVSLSVCTPARYADILCDRLRNYMRPVMEGEIPDSPDKTLAQYGVDTATWRHTVFELRDTKQVWPNPWHPDLRNSMFYL